MSDRGNLETILGVVGALSAVSLVGIISYKIATSSNRRETETIRAVERSSTPNAPMKRTFGQALELFYEGNPTERCKALENDILPLSFHDDGCKYMIQDTRLCNALLSLFSTPPSTSDEVKQQRLAGWVLGNISFNHIGQTALPMMKIPDKGPFLQHIHDEIQRISTRPASEIISQYDVTSPLQSPFLSMLQMLVNFSSHDKNLSILVDSDSLELVCVITAKILGQSDNEKLLVHLLRILVNTALAIQKLPIPRTTGQLYTQRSIQNTCHQVSNAPHSEEIAERLVVIQNALREAIPRSY